LNCPDKVKNGRYKYNIYKISTIQKCYNFLKKDRIIVDYKWPTYGRNGY